MRSYSTVVDQDKLERIETDQWRKILFGLCFMHSVVQERRKFGPLGWCIPYEYNTADLSACMAFLEAHLYNGPISWSTVQYMVSEVQYGGKITDDFDRRLMATYCAAWMNPSITSADYSYNPASLIEPISGDFNYSIPDSQEHADYISFLEKFPQIDSPEISGLHPNADLTFRIKEVNQIQSTLSMTQPKGSGGGTVSREDVVYEKAGELVDKMPAFYDEEDYKAKIKALGGLGIPLNIFLYQEIQRFQAVLLYVKQMLVNLQLAIKGEVVMTEQLQEAIGVIYEAKVPAPWTFTPGGDEFSWISPSLGLWFTSLLQRDEQLRTWMNKGRPNCFWMTGFANPNGFLTAMRQEVCRQHKADDWALDDVIYQTDVTDFERFEQVKAPPKEGQYVHGLFLDGAGWDKSGGHLAESTPKILFAPLPVLYITGTKKGLLREKVKQGTYGPSGPYECPTYKYPARTGRFYIFQANIATSAEKNADHWCLRGTALLCSTD
jgi:dynein heavy chain